MILPIWQVREIFDYSSSKPRRFRKATGSQSTTWRFSQRRNFSLRRTEAQGHSSWLQAEAGPRPRSPGPQLRTLPPDCDVPGAGSAGQEDTQEGQGATAPRARGSKTGPPWSGQKPAVVLKEVATSRLPPRDGTGTSKGEDLGIRANQEGTVGGGRALRSPESAYLVRPTRSQLLRSCRLRACTSRERRRISRREPDGSGRAAVALLRAASPSAACPLPRWRRRCLARSAGRAGGSCSCGACPVRGRPNRGAGWRGDGARGPPSLGAGRKRPW